ncbi:predicted protein [Sclerotinia sclerotiorum 1980 UF-70]|uniref:Uncharacterized protein n=1 Tax=Sclerotinia sclerotiorum (strain ATCC 18683 / 1980 / Ss-1) TaxID=665079 RepID=A7E6X0_SCLS1|nr:predicted protein [Sclerotinia sclerotiorum 1980 UF-70]EDN91642.1 predicted protein [Sclerotinia sclerotiorum 1980 UF-70]
MSVLQVSSLKASETETGDESSQTGLDSGAGGGGVEHEFVESLGRVQTRSDFIELVCDLGHLKIVCARTIRNRVIRSLEEPESS